MKYGEAFFGGIETPTSFIPDHDAPPNRRNLTQSTPLNIEDGAMTPAPALRSCVRGGERPHEPDSGYQGTRKARHLGDPGPLPGDIPRRWRF
ncbi:MAG: hypothetical protein CM15mP103_08830 [Gammaproteobacteria bacterium]|nr:MAG: hypothetical protein CM15mP103_08830 [Gammaproteobacteria bacterium]